VAVLLAVVVVLLVRDDGEPEPVAPVSRSEAARLAREACAGFDRFEDLVDDNADSDTVFDQLDAARESARQAATGDPAWLDLSGALEAMEIALSDNDPGAARIAVDVTHTACARAGG
jgi:hypothetical protein